MLFAAAVLCAGLLLLCGCGSKPSASAPASNNPSAASTNSAPSPVAGEGRGEGAPAAETKGTHAYIGNLPSSIPGKARRKNTVLATRRGNAVYQALIRYEPEPVPVTDVPELTEVVQVLAAQGKQVPSQIARIDEETEMLVHNLGESLRAVTSYRAYVNPLDGHVLAYDLAQTNGGQAQRFIGRLTKQGVKVQIERGSQPVDTREVPFNSKGTFIPVEIELLVHQLYEANKATLKEGQPITFSIFVPGYMSTVMVLARPQGEEVISVGDATYDCARYEVQAVSAQAAEGTRASQQMWFDKRTGFLMKRVDVDPGLSAAERPVTERIGIDQVSNLLNKLDELKLPPPVLPKGVFPYALDTDLHYTIRARDAEIGRLRLSFSQAPKGSPGPFMSRAQIVLDTKGSKREESAITYYDADWQAINYQTKGEEIADVKADYRIGAEVAGNRLKLNLSRQVKELPPPPEKKEEPARPTDDPLAKPLQKDTPEPADGWKDPLVRVPVSDEDAKAQEQEVDLTRSMSQTMERAFLPGTCLYDFNRVEHLAAFAFRLPVPELPKPGEAAQDVRAYQNVGLISIRQNRSGVLQFEIKPEPKPVLTEKQKRRLDPRDREEPQLFIAQSTLALLPCRMLLTPDGRILELAVRFGSGEVIYTLDDPIMNRRAEKARKQKLQEGPRLLRPPWW